MSGRHRPLGWFRVGCVAVVLWATSVSAWAQEAPFAPPVVGGPAEAAPAVEAPPPPQGKGWIFLPTIGINEIVTDNVRETSVSRQADLISVVSPGLSITGDTARVKVNLSFSPIVQRYVKASDQNFEGLNLFGTGEAAIIQDLLFFDANASSSQSNINGGQAFTNTNLIPGSQRTQTFATSFGPVLRTDIGTLAHAELLYQFGTTRFTNNTTVPGSTGLSNTTQNEGRLNLSTGEDFGRLNSTLVLDALKSSGASAGSSNTDKRAEVDSQYAITRKVSLLAQFGYEDQTFPGSTAAAIRGPIAQGGASYTPNPDTSVRLLYGRRQGSDDFSGDLRFAVTAATKVSVTYTQTVETTQQLILQNLGNAALGPGGTVINPVTGLPFPVVNPNFPLQNNVFRFRTLQAGVTSTLNRNTFTLTAFHEQETSLSGVNSSNGTSSGGSFQWTREMSPRMNGSLLLGYASNGGGGGGGTTNVSAGITYALSDTLNGGLRYDYINGSGGVAFGGIGGTKFTQSALTLSLIKKF